MSFLSVISTSMGFAGVTGAVVTYANVADAAAVDIWALIEKGGAPMAAVLLLALIEVTRRHDRAYKTIEAKDATILALSERQTAAIETTNEISNAHMETARKNEALLRELVTLLRGKLDIG